MDPEIEELAAQLRVLSVVIEQTLVDAGDRSEAVVLLGRAVIKLSPAIEALARVIPPARASAGGDGAIQEQRESIAALRVMRRVRARRTH